MLWEVVYMKNGGLEMDVALHIGAQDFFTDSQPKKVVDFFQFFLTFGDG